MIVDEDPIAGRNRNLTVADRAFVEPAVARAVASPEGTDSGPRRPRLPELLFGRSLTDRCRIARLLAAPPEMRPAGLADWELKAALRDRRLDRK